MRNHNIIENKTARLAEFLNELEDVRPKGSFDDYRKNPSIKRSCERLIQLIVESAADINSTFVIGLNEPPPKDYYDTFIKAGETGLIDKSLAEELAPWAGLRNRLVHEYEAIKDRLVYEKIGPTIARFKEYLKQVERSIRLSKR